MIEERLWGRPKYCKGGSSGPIQLEKHWNITETRRSRPSLAPLIGCLYLSHARPCAKPDKYLEFAVIYSPLLLHNFLSWETILAAVGQKFSRTWSRCIATNEDIYPTPLYEEPLSLIAVHADYFELITLPSENRLVAPLTQHSVPEAPTSLEFCSLAPSLTVWYSSCACDQHTTLPCPQLKPIQPRPRLPGPQSRPLRMSDLPRMFRRLPLSLAWVLKSQSG